MHVGELLTQLEFLMNLIGILNGSGASVENDDAYVFHSLSHFLLCRVQWKLLN